MTTKLVKEGTIEAGDDSCRRQPTVGTAADGTNARLYVQEERFDEVVSGVADIAKSIKLGDGMDPDTQMGPLVSDEQLQRVTGYLDAGRSDGATALTGGVRRGDRGYFVEPTVLTGTRPDMRVVREEIFGPVVCGLAVPKHRGDRRDR